MLPSTRQGRKKTRPRPDHPTIDPTGSAYRMRRRSGSFRPGYPGDESKVAAFLRWVVGLLRSDRLG